MSQAIFQRVASSANERWWFARYNCDMSNQNSYCDLDHVRPRPAVVRVQVKSSRARRPGHPMIREIALCNSHARQLREFGIQIVDA